MGKENLVDITTIGEIIKDVFQSYKRHCQPLALPIGDNLTIRILIVRIHQRFAFSLSSHAFKKGAIKCEDFLDRIIKMFQILTMQDERTEVRNVVNTETQ